MDRQRAVAMKAESGDDPLWGILLVGLWSLLAACSSNGSRKQEAFESQVTRTVMALEAQDDADSLAAAAQLPSNSAAERLSLLNRAVTLAPDRTDLVWLQLEECEHVAACDPAPLAAMLYRLDPQNGAAWAPLLNRAAKEDDSVGVDKYLRAIASSKRFDIYWNASIAHLSRAVVQVHTMDSSTALTAVIGSEAALAIPPFQNLSKGCKAPALDESDRKNVCRSIAAVMLGGDTYITEMMGFAIAQRVWPEDSREYADAVVARRVAQYRMHTQGTIALTLLRTDADAEKYASLLATHRSEQDVALAVITGAGKNPDPPLGSGHD